MDIFSIITKRIEHQKRKSSPYLLQNNFTSNQKVVYLSRTNEQKLKENTQKTITKFKGKSLGSSLNNSHEKNPYSAQKKGKALRQNKKSAKLKKSKQETSKPIIGNKMQEYLRIFKSIKEVKCESKKQFIYSSQSDHIFSTGRLTHRRAQTTKKEKIASSLFKAILFPEFFQLKVLTHPSKLPQFNEILIINIKNYKYCRKSLKQNLIQHREDLKKICSSLNHFSVNLCDCIFFCVIFQTPLFDRTISNFQSFFLIGKPLKHSQKDLILPYIEHFLRQCKEEILSSFNRKENDQKQKKFIQKFWIIDYEGRISFVKKQKLVAWPEEEYSSNEKNQKIQNVLKMFTKVFTKGNYNIQSSFAQKNS